MVLDLTQYLSGPYCTMLLADAGADVYKIERPPDGDPGRSLGPFVTRDGQRISTYFARMHRNKRSVALDVGTDDGRDVLLAMARSADVIVENFKPGVMDKLGLGWDTLRKVNDRLIYASVSGFGHHDLVPSPSSSTPAYDVVVLAESGVLGLIGEDEGRPLWPGFGLGDLYPATTAALGIVMALFRRGSDGLGGRVDCAMVESSLVLAEGAISRWQLLGQEPKRGQETIVAPYGAYEASDGYVALAVVSPSEWEAFCEIIDAEDLKADESLKSAAARVSRSGEIRQRIERWLSRHPKREAVRLLLDGGVPAGVVATPEDVLRSRHLEQRGAFIGFEEGAYSGLRLPGPPCRLDGWLPKEAKPPPSLGENTFEAITALTDMDEAYLERLRKK